MRRTTRTLRLAVATLAAAVTTILATPAAHAGPAPTQGPATCADADVAVHDYNHFLAQTPDNPLGALFALTGHLDRAGRAAFCLANNERVARGLPALVWSDRMRDSARAHAREAQGQKWWVAGANSHINPRTPRTFPDDQREQNVQIDRRIRATQPCTFFVGDPTQLRGNAENNYHGWGTGSTPRAAVNWWMGSPAHRAAILNPAFNRLGVGVIGGAADPNVPQDPAGIFVQHFGTCS